MSKTKSKQPAKRPAKAQDSMSLAAPHEPRYRDGKLLCNAKQDTCGAFACKGRTKCRNHGGESLPAGPTHPTYIHGLRSKYIPARLAAKYGESMADPDLMAYQADIALLQSRLYELLETGESEPLWSKAQEAFQRYKAAAGRAQRAEVGSSERATAAAQMSEALAQVESLINRGQIDSIRWADIYKVTEQMGRTKEREHKRLVQMQQMITAEQLLAVLGQIANAAKQTITNPAEFAAFSAALSQYGVVSVERNAYNDERGN